MTSETRILIGRLCAPSDPQRPWWWQSSTTVDGTELIVGGFAATEQAAILEAAASTIDLGWHDDVPAPLKPTRDDPRYHEPGWWPGLTDGE